MSILKHIHINCKEATYLLSVKDDKPIPFGQKIKLKFHLYICPPCLHFAKQIEILKKSLKSFASSDNSGLSKSKKEELEKIIQENM